VRALALVALAGCATLGPVPATSGLSPVPAPREGGEIQLAAVPGYFLSQTVVEDPHAETLANLTVALDPAELLGVPGLVVAARLIGPDEDPQLEPIAGYRRSFGAGLGISLAGFVFGAHSRGEVDGASVTSTRIGGELAADFRLGPASRLAEPHLLLGASLGYVDAQGTYCVDVNGRYGVDCHGDFDDQISGSLAGAYPAATAGVAAHLARHRPGVFHGARVFLVATVGAMPTVVSGVQDSATGYLSLGFGLSLALGR